MNDAHRIPYESMMVHSFFQMEEEEEEERGFVTR